MSHHEDRASQVAEIAKAYAYRRRNAIEHTGHTQRRLLEAVSILIGHRVLIEDKLLTELKALLVAVQPYARMAEHVDGLGAPVERARRAIAAAEGRCQAQQFAHLPAPELVTSC